MSLITRKPCSTGGHEPSNKQSDGVGLVYYACCISCYNLQYKKRVRDVKLLALSVTGGMCLSRAP
eukprot:COSAG02_NODE_64_length_43111_cov_35.627709_25_plen_65_part_00